MTIPRRNGKIPVIPLGEVSQSGRKYGTIPDKPDHRDKLVRFFVAKPPKLPAHVDLSRLLGPVRDQQNLGACTGFAYAGIREFLNNKYMGSPKIFSPLYIYYKERELEGTVNEDAGAFPRDGCRVLYNFGVCLEQEDSYQPVNFAVKPTPQMEQQASAFKALAYHRAMNLLELRLALASGFCPSVGFDVYDSFEGDFIAKTGHMPVPDVNRENLLGGHEVFAFGYDDSIQNSDGTSGALMIRNSWGILWGMTGNFYMPYSFVTPQFVSDIWVVNPGRPWKIA
jgi:C1A family cysteine protease